MPETNLEENLSHIIEEEKIYNSDFKSLIEDFKISLNDVEFIDDELRSTITQHNSDVDNLKGQKEKLDVPSEILVPFNLP